MLRVRLQLTAVPLRIEKHLRETVATLGLELLRMLREEIAQLGLGRFGHRMSVLGYELQLLRHVAADDDIVFVQMQGHRFAIENFLAHRILHHAIQFLARRRSPVQARETRRELFDAPFGDDDRVPAETRAPVQPAIGQEQPGADQQELQRRFAQPATHGSPR